MSAPIQKHLVALKDFESRMKARGEIDTKTIKIQMRGAEAFVLFLMGTDVKRDERTKGLLSK
jgi:hypothetical protein